MGGAAGGKAGDVERYGSGVPITGSSSERFSWEGSLELRSKGSVGTD